MTPVWFLLEYAQAWGKKAFEESNIPDPVKEHLSALQKKFPGSRLQLIKGQPAKDPAGIAFFVCLAAEAEPQVYEFQLDDYADLLELDIAAILAGGPVYQAQLRRTPLYLVCTNGKRDPCCAREGVPVYTSLAARLPDAAWQTTHIGGHRFAANVICFPAGICYGRLSPDQVDGLIEAGQQDEVYLEKYRGRVCYPEAVQAAEYYLRQQTGRCQNSTFRLIDCEEAAPNQWVVRFGESQTGQEHRLVIVSELAPFQVYQSCRDEQPAAVVQYRLQRRFLSQSQGEKMNLLANIQARFGSGKSGCKHLNLVQEVVPSAQGCEDCLQLGDSWVNLRLCLICGHVGCCDNSKNKHATKHFHTTGHPIIQSFEPGEEWLWCYVDDLFMA